MSFKNRVHELKEMIRSSSYRYSVPEATAQSGITHPSCGDEILFSARIHDGKIIEIGVLGSGCLLSQAAGIIAAEYAHGKLLSEIVQCSDDMLIKALNIGHVGPTRRQCITIVTEALKKLVSLEIA
jgi:NifU-like protein involved in Fe-S cluster formation